MPFINDDELEELNEKIHTVEEEQKIENYAHIKELREAKENTHKFKITTIILGIIAAIGVAGTIYFMTYTPGGMLSQKDSKKLKIEIQTLKEENASMAETIANSNTDSGDSDEDQASIGGEIIYAVQIGAFEKKDLSMYSDKFVNFREIKSGSFNKYALGNFATLNEAKKFRRELVGLGFKNAFIASYKNDQRIKIEEAW